MKFEFEDMKWFIGLIAMGVVLLILGAICTGSAGKSDETSKNNCSRSGWGIIVISIFIILLGVWLAYNQNGAGANKEFKLYYY